jgi:host factor-I protein
VTSHPCVQGGLLRTHVKDKTTVNVFLVNAIRLTGQLVCVDQIAVLPESGLGVQIVFNNAISTAMPVNVKDAARNSTEAPMSRDKPNHLRGRVP